MHMLRRVQARYWLLQILIIIFISFAFKFLVVKNFSEPLAGGSDIDIWEYIGFYLKNNLSFAPFPTLNLNNNQVVYPYGTNSVFQTWAFERDIFYAISYSFFGIGSWLQIYYIITILVT